MGSPSMAQLQQLLSLTEDALFVFSVAEGTVTFMNEPMEALSGFSFDELKQDPQRWLARVHPDDRDKALGAAAWLVSAEARVRYRYAHPRDGERVLEARLSAIAQEGVVVALVRDVTAAERRGLASADELRALLAGLPVAVVVGREGRVVLANRAAVNAFPRLAEPSALLSTALPPALAALERSEVAECGALALPGPHPRHLSFVVSPLEIAGLAHTMWTANDETARVESERLLGAATAERNLLERSLLVSEVSAFVTHELSQPLASITAWVEGVLARLGRPGSQAELAAALEQALAQCQRAARLVSRVRSLIVSGDVSSEPVALRALFERASRGLRTRPLELSAPEGLQVFVDPMYAEVGLMTALRFVAGSDVSAAAHIEGDEAVLVLRAARPREVSGRQTALELAVAATAITSLGGALSHDEQQVVLRLPTGPRPSSPSWVVAPSLR